MDRMSDIASFVATSAIESDANVAMEGYLAELLEFNTSMAMEAFDAKKAMQDAGVAIKRFIEGAKRRVLEMIGNIIRRIGEMMAALSNRMHTKDVEVPQEMGNAYLEMVKIVEDMTDKSGDYVDKMTNYVAAYNGKITASELFGRIDPIKSFADDRREETEKMKAELEKIVKADVLKGQSVDAYMAELIEAKNSRKIKINPAAEQKKLSKMRGVWQRAQNRLKSSAFDVGPMLDLQEAMTPENQKAAVMRMRMLFNETFNAAMQRTVAALNAISHLQKYVTGFVIISKKYPAMTDVIREPAAGALPAHT